MFSETGPFKSSKGMLLLQQNAQDIVSAYLCGPVRLVS